MHVIGKLVFFFLSSALFLFSCGKSDGNAPTQFSSDDPAPDLPASANIYGRVNDSLTALPIANASVTVYSAGVSVSSTTTDGNGDYHFGNFNNGSYAMDFVAQNYVSIINSTVILAGVSKSINKSMSPPTLTGQIRIVMSWYSANLLVSNIAPDLDAYLLNLNDTSGSNATNYGYTSNTWSDGSSADLDQDSTNYAGPETITLSNLNSSSVYHFYVHNYSNYQDCMSLGVSGVHVDVYSGSSIIKSYDLQANSSGGAIYEFFTIQNGLIVDTGHFDETLPLVAGPSMAVCTP